MFDLAFQRAPAAGELQDARRLAGAHGFAALARVIFNSNEFLHVD